MNDPLFETLCRKQTLYTAWLKVKEKNTTGGIDYKTVEDYARNVDQNLDDLSQKLIAGTYIQQPYREVFIPKKENEKRRLGLLTVNDKVVQTAVNQIITPIFEKSFLPVSYAYRENKSAVKAIRQVQHLIKNEHYTWLASCDIDNFFDNIPHAPLFGRLNAFLKSPGITELMKMFVMMGSVNYKKQWKNTVKGIPQGGVVSPVLANFYLYQLDKLMMDKKYGFVRYADDFILLGKTETQANEALKDAVQVITKQLGLTLKKFNRLREKLHDAAETGQAFISSKLTETIQGITNFYGKLVSQEKLNQLDIEIIKQLKKRWIRLNPDQSIHFPNQLQTIMLLAEANLLNKTGFLHQHWGIKEKVK